MGWVERARLDYKKYTRSFAHAEAALAARGVALVQYSSPVSRPCDALYRRLGARATETVWHKTLRPVTCISGEAH